MTTPLIPWLMFVASCGLLAYLSPKLAIPFAIITAVTLPLCFLPLSHPSPHFIPEGTVIGAKIDYEKAIYVMIDGDEPRLFVLPYSEEQAMNLQGLMQGEGSATMVRGDGGEFVFEENPVGGYEK